MLFAVAGFGALVGAVLGLVGAGGAIIAVPALVTVLGIPVAHAMTTSLVMAATSSIAAVLPRLRRDVHWPLAAVVAAVGVPSAFAGTAVNGLLPQPVLLIAFAVLMVAAAILLLRPRIEQPDGARPRRWVLRGIAVGLVVGFLTGLLGVGGGFVIVPALLLLLRLSMPMAIGTSLVITIANSAAGVLAHASAGAVDWETTIAFAAPAFVASLVTARFATRLSADALRISFAVVVLLVAVLTLTQGIIALL